MRQQNVGLSQFDDIVKTGIVRLAKSPGLAAVGDGYAPCASGCALRQLYGSGDIHYPTLARQIHALPAKYKLIAQSLSLNTEGVYSIGAGSFDNDKWKADKESFTDVSNYEPNDRESQARTLGMNSQTTSYLHKNDLDFWIIDMSE